MCCIMSLQMSLFESIIHLPRNRFEMPSGDRQSIFRLVAAAMVTFVSFWVCVGALFNFAFPETISQDISIANLLPKNAKFSTEFVLTTQLLLVFSILMSFVAHQSELMGSATRLRQLLQEENDDKPINSPSTFGWLLFLVVGVFLSLKVPQSIELLLQFDGGLFVPILAILLPILIFNKLTRHLHDQMHFLRYFNWGVFFSIIVIGGVGTTMASKSLSQHVQLVVTN